MPSKEEPLIFAGGSSRDTTEQHPEDAFGRFGTVVEAQVKPKAAFGNSKEGHRRAQFLKPMPRCSLPTTDLSSLEHIEDPEEYFMACERFDIADKELKRLRGEVATDLTEHQRSRTAREHRAGILGKRYHFTPSTDLTDALSKTRYDRIIVGPSDTSSVAESSDNLHREATEPPRISHASRSLPTIDFSILDDIKDPEEYFSTFGQLAIADKELKRLSGEVATDLTQHLRSRTVRERCPGILGKRHHFTPNTDLIEALSKIPPDRSIAGPSNISSVAESRVKLHPEATDQRGSVFDATEKEGSVAGKDKSAQDLLEDLLSAYKTLDADAANAYLRKRLEVKSIDDSKTHLPELSSIRRNDRRTLDNEVTKKLDGPQLSYMPSTHIGSRLAEIPSLQSRISMINPLEDIPMPPIDVSPSYSLPSGDDEQSDDLIFAQPDPELENLPSGYMKQNDAEIMARSTISRSGHDIDAGSFGLHAILQSEVNVVAEGEPVSGAQVSKNNSSPSGTVLPVDGLSENLCILPVENDETQGLEEAAGVSPNRGQKKSVPKTRQNKQKPTSKRQKLTSRKSLADAGLTWKSGVRRSTRIKSRPLEHWCGERFLYGRIHESLATVIGVKYATPRQDNKDKALKVKSFVPKKYAHLIAQAAAS